MVYNTGSFENAFEQINFRAIFENQREKLIEELKGDLIYAYGGGYFIINPTLFFELKMNIDENKSSAIMLDMNLNPIKIDNLAEVLTETRSLYTEAVNKYRLGVDRIKKSRLIPTMVNLEDDIEE